MATGAELARDVRYVSGKGLVLPDGRPASFITTDELANLVHLTAETVRSWCVRDESGSLKYPELRWTRVGRRTRFFSDSVIKILENHSGHDTKEVGSAHSEKTKAQIRKTMLATLAKKKAALKKAQAAGGKRGRSGAA